MPVEVELVDDVVARVDDVEVAVTVDGDVSARGRLRRRGRWGCR